jgi:hypothetical protein
MPPLIPGPVTDSHAATWPQTHGRLLSLHPLAGCAPVPPHVLRPTTGSHAAMCPQTHARLAYLHSLTGWALMPPCAPELMTGFLLSASLRGGLPYHHVSLGPQLAPVSRPRVLELMTDFLLSALCR